MTAPGLRWTTDILSKLEGARMTPLATHCEICPGRPREAEHGMVCLSCSNRILRTLRELEEHLTHLSLEKRRGGETRRAPGFASQSPANDQVILHTDWRTGWDPIDGLGAVATIHSWARAVREERAYQPPAHITLATELQALRTNHDWLMGQRFVAEYARELAEVHMSVRVTAGDPPPRPVGRCITVHPHGECGGPVHEREWAGDVQCARCRRVYDGTSLVHLRLAQDTTT